MPKFPFISFWCKIHIWTLQGEVKKVPVRSKKHLLVLVGFLFPDQWVSLGIDRMEEEENHQK